jgi:hypothetical protein
MQELTIFANINRRLNSSRSCIPDPILLVKPCLRTHKGAFQEHLALYLVLPVKVVSCISGSGKTNFV